MNQLDHPFILVSQAVIVYGLFRYFFQIRHRDFPVPLSAASFAFITLANLIARATHASWFVVADVLMFVAMAVQILVAIAYNNKHPELLPTPVNNDRLDSFATRLVSLSGVVAITFVLLSLHNTYYERIENAVAINTVARQVDAKVRTEQLSADRQDSTWKAQQTAKLDTALRLGKATLKTAGATLTNTHTAIGNQGMISTLR